MKRFLSFFLALLMVFSFSACSPDSQDYEPKTSFTDPASLPDLDITLPAKEESPPDPEPEQESVTVYITKSGEKYHRSGCQYLRKSCIAISLDSAKSKGYGPCSKCKPPQ